jgi:hypothetical protein
MSLAVRDECPMAPECPGYDLDLRRCLIRPGDCDFADAPADMAAARAGDRTVWQASESDGTAIAG